MIIFKVDSSNPDPDAIGDAADAIRRGELVIFPTETVYGLAADAFNEAAVRLVIEVKSRGESHPLPVQIAGVDQLNRVAAEVPPEAEMLARRFWPGPLTLVLPKNAAISNAVTGGKSTVGVRVPNHPVALALLRELDSPIVATSANISGRQAPTSAGSALRGFGNMISVVLDSGESEIGVASTVVDVSVKPPRVLRRGAISLDQIREVVGEAYEL